MKATAPSKRFVWFSLECCLHPAVPTRLYLNCLECPKEGQLALDVRLWTLVGISTSFYFCPAKKRSPAWSPFQKVEGGCRRHLRESSCTIKVLFQQGALNTEPPLELCLLNLQPNKHKASIWINPLSMYVMFYLWFFYRLHYKGALRHPRGVVS